jgi:hypothetical protein
MPFRLFQRAPAEKNQTAADLITIVSGLPRSGTSMMMRMLEAGGLPVMTDHIRTADESNPKGYFELEQVKQMKDGDTRWVGNGRGKVVKVISLLLEYLPPEHEYRIVFMQRNMGEILASQREMLKRRGEPVDRIGDHYMADLYQDHLAKVAEWLAAQPNMKVLYLHYNQIMENPRPSVAQLSQFMQPISLDVARMLGVVEASLYRQRDQQVGQAVQQT